MLNLSAFKDNPTVTTLNSIQFVKLFEIIYNTQYILTMSDKNKSLDEFRRREEDKKKRMEKEKEELEKRKRESKTNISGHVAKAGFLSEACNAHKSYNPGLADNENFKRIDKNLSNSVWKKYGK